MVDFQFIMMPPFPTKLIAGAHDATQTVVVCAVCRYAPCVAQPFQDFASLLRQRPELKKFVQQAVSKR